MNLIFATRPSKLARWQTQHVIDSVKAAWPGLSCEERLITTSGDRILDRPLTEIGGKGLFTQELETELLAGRVHAAVHSLKDLPVDEVPPLAGWIEPPNRAEDAGGGASTPGLRIGAILPRGEARDALVSSNGYTLESLPAGARVGTSSLRRAAQLLALRPDLEIRPLRGNVDTRVRKALDGEYEAILLAGAGLSRLGLEEHISQWLTLDTMLPAPGQGALAVQCRADDEETLRLLAPLEDPFTRLAVTAERAFLSGLGGGCSLPVGAHARASNGKIALDGMVASPSGGRVLRVYGEGQEPLSLGLILARQAIDRGAAGLIAGSAGDPAHSQEEHTYLPEMPVEPAGSPSTEDRKP